MQDDYDKPLKSVHESTGRGLIHAGFRLLLVLLMGKVALAAPPGMTLNFNVGPNNNTFAPGACNMSNAPLSATGYQMCGIGGGSDPDDTRFYHGTYTDPITFVDYWHTIVGDPDTGFAMESYTAKIKAFESTSGGRPTRIMGWANSLELLSGNGWDPLGFDSSRDFDYTGNGTADPNRTLVRQVMGGSWDSNTGIWHCDASHDFCAEFTKDEFLFKPKITQRINDASLTHEFVLDMSAIDYSDDTTAAALINTLALTATGMPDPTAGNFQMTNNAIMINAPGRVVSRTNPSVTGGRYIYTQCGNPQIYDGIGHCWQSNDVYSWDYQEGEYSYVEGGVDVLNYEWGLYWDPAQNGDISGNESKCLNGLGASNC